MRTCMRLTADGNYQASRASWQLLGDPCRSNLARPDSKSGVYAERKQGNLACRITILLVPEAWNVMYGFSNCQRPPISNIFHFILTSCIRCHYVTDVSLGEAPSGPYHPNR